MKERKQTTRGNDRKQPGRRSTPDTEHWGVDDRQTDASLTGILHAWVEEERRDQHEIPTRAHRPSLPLDTHISKYSRTGISKTKKKCMSKIILTMNVGILVFHPPIHYIYHLFSFSCTSPCSFRLHIPSSHFFLLFHYLFSPIDYSAFSCTAGF